MMGLSYKEKLMMKLFVSFSEAYEFILVRQSKKQTLILLRKKIIQVVINFLRPFQATYR